MSSHEIARQSIATALERAADTKIDPADVLHAFLVSMVDGYQAEVPEGSVRNALELLLENLDDSRDYEFMRP